MANIYSDIKAKVKRYEPLISVNREFLALSQSITENAPSPRLKSKQTALLLFTRAATLFEAIQELCANLKTIEGFILLRSLLEISAYLHYIWSGGIASKAEREKRAQLYGMWELIEDKKILDMIKQGNHKFHQQIVTNFLAKEQSINNYYQTLLTEFPELKDKNRRKKGWHGFGSLEALAKQIDRVSGAGAMETEYNSLVRQYNWAVHSGIKSVRDNLVMQGKNRTYKYGGNEEHMFAVLVTSFLTYQSFVAKLSEIFRTGLKPRIKTFAKQKFNPVVEHLRKQIRQ